jgi:hypothetical protein
VGASLPPPPPGPSLQAVVLLECMLGALSDEGPSPLTSADAVQRLLGDVFGYDMDAFIAYTRAEPSLAAAVALLDEEEGAGWGLLRDLVDGRRSAAELAERGFCLRGT